MEKQRADARGVTVDALHSRDLDDAIWVEKLPNGWIVEVTIADVAAEVRLGSSIDQNARKQGFTRYHFWGNEPMLPRSLADVQLSLLEGQPRRTITIFISLDLNVEVKAVDVGLTQFRSARRMSHHEVDEILENPNHQFHQSWLDSLELAQRLLNKRREKGALVIYDLTKGLMTDEDGNVVKTPSGKHYRAYLIVQELMILANTEISKLLEEKGVTFLFRNHATRHDEVRAQYLEMLSSLLIEPTTEMLDQLGREVRHLLGRARYGPINEGHFALNLPVYAHWTSPIRRYADLVNQRILHAWLSGNSTPYSLEELSEIADHLTQVSEEQREAPKDKYKASQLNRLVNANADALLALESGDFSYFVQKLADDTIPMTVDRAATIIRRLKSHPVEMRDMTRILFAETKTGRLWSRVREAALSWLREHPQYGAQVYHTASQMYGWPALDELDYNTEASTPGKAPEFQVIASVSHGGREYRAAVASGLKQREAEQAALLGLIAEIAGLRQESVQKPSVSKEKQEEIVNAKGVLLELAQQYKTAPPGFSCQPSGPGHEPVFTCVATFRYKGQTFRSDPMSASNKKQAEQNASADLLRKLPPELIRNQGADSLLSTGGNAVNALQEWLQAQKRPLPDYAFIRSGQPHSPIFTCTVTISGDSRSWKGVGLTKQTAKLEAAKAAYNAVRGK